MLESLFFFTRILLFPKNLEERKAKSLLYNQHSFSYQAEYQNSLIGNIKVYWVFLKKIFNSNNQNPIPKNESLVYTTTSNIFEEYEKVLYENGKSENKSYIARGQIYTYINDNVTKFKILSLSFLMFIILIMTMIFTKKRFNHFLLIESFFISYIVYRIIKLENIKILYHFNIHDPETNFMYLLCRKLEVFQYKIPNNNPLFMFNKNILYDCLVLLTPYQVDESIYFGFKNYELWKDLSKSKFFNKEFNIKNNGLLVYYSHGTWMRKNHNHTPTWFNEAKNEITFLNEIRKTKLFNEKIAIALHPIEKKHKNKDLILEFYQKVFGKNVYLLDCNTSSYDSFKQFDIGISCLSSIAFERIYCGYITLMYIKELENNFPVDGSLFCEFTSYDIDKFVNKILLLKEKKTTNSEFFKNLQKYTYIN